MQVCRKKIRLALKEKICLLINIQLILLLTQIMHV